VARPKPRKEICDSLPRTRQDKRIPVFNSREAAQNEIDELKKGGRAGGLVPRQCPTCLEGKGWHMKDPNSLPKLGIPKRPSGERGSTNHQSRHRRK